jgi:hypothetical protein
MKFTLHLKSFVLFLLAFILISCETDKGEKPEITLIGGDTVNWVLNTPYYELGYTATDEEDGDLTFDVEVNTDYIDVNRCGSYIITYKVRDYDDNKTEVKRILAVENESRLWEAAYSCVDEIQGQAYPAEIRELIVSDTINNRIHFPKFGGYENARIYGIIDPNTSTITIPNQSVQCGIDNINRSFVSSIGNVTQNQIIINYTITEGASTVNATSTYTK